MFQDVFLRSFNDNSRKGSWIYFLNIIYGLCPTCYTEWIILAVPINRLQCFMKSSQSKGIVFAYNTRGLGEAPVQTSQTKPKYEEIVDSFLCQHISGKNYDGKYNIALKSFSKKKNFNCMFVIRHCTVRKRELLLFRNYFINRKQYVQIGHCKSSLSTADIKPGFEPQASHQNKSQIQILRRFPLNRFLTKTLRVN